MVFSKRERDWRKELAEESWCEEDASGMYADDLLEGSVDVKRARERYLRKIECFVKVGCGIKESCRQPHGKPQGKKKTQRPNDPLQSPRYPQNS
jgi:hypothetical protein